MPTRTDEQLVAAANAGDAAAFEVLYERYRDWVRSLAARFTGDHDLALDVMQDTFTYLLGKFPGFVLTAQMKTFLYPVVRHNALAARRRSRRMSSGGPLPEIAVETSDPKDRDLLNAVDRLPDAQREVLILRYADDLALSEIALALGVPLGTVKSRLHHAHAALRAGAD